MITSIHILLTNANVPGCSLPGRRRSPSIIHGANYGRGLYVSFLFVNLAGVIISAVMLRSSVVGKFPAWMGDSDLNLGFA